MKLSIHEAIHYLNTLLPKLETIHARMATSLITYLEVSDADILVLKEFYDTLIPHGTAESQRVTASKFISTINTLAEAQSITFSIVRDKSKKKPDERTIWFEGRSMSIDDIQKMNDYETSALPKGAYAPLSVGVGDIPLYKVFFSHADIDRELVQDLLWRMKPYAKTKEMTLNFWLFREELLRGEDASKVMLDNLADADAVLFAVSPQFTASSFILEYELPIGLKKVNTPFFLRKPDLDLLNNHHDVHIRDLRKLWLDSLGYSEQASEDAKNAFAKKLVVDLMQHIEKKKALS